MLKRVIFIDMHKLHAYKKVFEYFFSRYSTTYFKYFSK